ncbi:DUF3540 domain-containing protein [Roseibium sp. Sym1]|uniref:DUF3540 domain-containing protein n=1 Tax=Roseibium sp. Sym1 TaxID=3016006 RepID=UPI0022B4ACA6|nr:DUF3540 domain-containing protein [Roseibium sp. Sym1]
MGLQTKAEACGAALDTDDTAFPQNLIAAQAGHQDKAVTGTVTGGEAGQDSGMFDLLVSGKPVRARRAVSCLVEPRVSDTVALLSTAEGVFITDVLLRSEEEAQALHINALRNDGTRQDFVLSAGNLRIDAEEGLEATGKRLAFRFDSMLMSSRQLALVGKKLMTSMLDIVTNAKTQLASFETTSTKTRNRVDRVVETDQLRAGSIQTQADTVALTQAGSALTVAKEDIRLDGKRISMG